VGEKGYSEPFKQQAKEGMKARTINNDIPGQ